MGHKVNPEIFRLGHSVDWKYQLRDPLLANIFVYRTVKKMFLQYSAPHVRYTIGRNTNPRAYTPKRLNAKMIRNPFLRSSFVFSHLNLSYAPSLHLAIFLLDAGAEHTRTKAKLPEDALYYLCGKFFPSHGRYNPYFLKQIYGVPEKKRFATSWFNYNVLYQICWYHKRDDVRSLRKFNSRNRLKRKRNRKGSPLFKRKKLLNLVGIWIYQIMVRCPSYVILVLSTIRKLRFLLRFVKYINTSFSKKRIFLLNLLIVSATTLIYFLKEDRSPYSRMISRRLWLFVVICNINLTSFKYLHLRYNKLLFNRRLRLFKLYSKILTFTLYKAMFIATDRRVIIKFFGLHNRNVNAHLLLNYFMVKLGQYFALGSIMNPLIRRLKRLDMVAGFRFVFAGRLTRKERASCIVENSKSMPLSTLKASVDYAFGFKIMKYGVVGIKVYVLLKDNPPYYYFFEFRNTI
jgi:hypothetical protein